MSSFEVPLRFELNVTVRALIKISGTPFEICSSHLVLIRGFPLSFSKFRFELSRDSEKIFRT